MRTHTVELALEELELLCSTMAGRCILLQRRIQRIQADNAGLAFEMGQSLKAGEARVATLSERLKEIEDGLREPTPF